MEARNYQLQGIDSIRDKFRTGTKKVLLWLATGAGKTFMFCKMVKESEARGNRAIIMVRGRKLVDQASQRLLREHVAHGVLMNKHWNFRPHLPVQVCSIDTLIARDLRPPAQLIIIDEAHLAVSEGYRQVLADYPDAFIVSVTATPWVDKGLRHIADTIVHPISMEELVGAGYLVPFRYFAPSEPDLRNVKISSSTKDYVTDQLEIAMEAGSLTGNIVEHYKKLASDRPALCFAVNVHHSKTLTERFRAGNVRAEHCDADTSDSERNAIIHRLETGETKVVCNVGILSTGIDIPSVSCLIMARPTTSRNLFIQQAGRGTRTFSGKENCLLLDHAGNIQRHGLPTDETEVDLDGRERKSHLRKSKICEACFAVYRAPICPECGVESKEEKIIEPPEETEDELKELREADYVLREYRRLQREGKRSGKKPAWAMYALVNKFTFDVASKYLDSWFVKRYQGEQHGGVFSNSPFVGLKK